MRGVKQGIEVETILGVPLEVSTIYLQFRQCCAHSLPPFLEVAQVRWTQEPPALLRYWCSVKLPGPDRRSSVFRSFGLPHLRRFRFSAASLPQESSGQAQSGASRFRTTRPPPP